MTFNLSPYLANFANMPWLKDGLIYLTEHGSTSYGTRIATSDLDLKGVVIPPPKYFLGFHNVFEQAETKIPSDFVAYDIRKFFRLAANCNPNIIEMLFTLRKHWMVKSETWELIHKNQHKFLSKKAFYTFSGYSTSQLKKIRTHPTNHKAMMHFVRLMRMCREILEYGRVQVFREDAEELLEIRAGKYDYDFFVDWADKEYKVLADLVKKSGLSDQPDMEFLDKLCIEVVNSHWESQMLTS
jgi:predicted nucleotidyltransferase